MLVKLYLHHRSALEENERKNVRVRVVGQALRLHRVFDYDRRFCFNH